METNYIRLSIQEVNLLIRHLRDCELTSKDPFVASNSDAWALDLEMRVNRSINSTQEENQSGKR